MDSMYTYDYHAHSIQARVERFRLRIWRDSFGFAWHGPLTRDGRPAPCESFSAGDMQPRFRPTIKV